MNMEQNGDGTTLARKRTVAPVVARLRAAGNANEAAARMRKLIALQSDDLQATLGHAFEAFVTAVEQQQDQLQDECRSAKAHADQPASPTPVAHTPPDVLWNLTGDDRARQIAEAFEPGAAPIVKQRVINICHQFFAVSNALNTLVEAVEFTPLGIRGIHALRAAKRALADVSSAAPESTGTRPPAPVPQGAPPLGPTAREQLIQHRVNGGSREDESRALLDDLLRRFAVKNLPAALVHDGFCGRRDADRLVARLNEEMSTSNP